MADDGAAWTDGELRRQLVALDLPSDVVVPIRVTGADLDPGRARRDAGTRRKWLVAILFLIVAAIVAAALVQAVREGLMTGSVLLILLLGSDGAIRWWASPTIRAPVVPQSQAAGFVASLLSCAGATPMAGWSRPPPFQLVFAAGCDWSSSTIRRSSCS